MSVALLAPFCFRQSPLSKWRWLRSGLMLGGAMALGLAGASWGQSCQALADHPDRGGPELLDVKVASASQTCLEELRRDPFSAQLMGLTARALQAEGKFEDAFGQASKAALLGDALAMNTLGLLYEKGGASSPGSLPDYFLARIWFEKSGRAGLGAGFYNLARLYRDGKGVAISDARADEYLAEAVSLGSVEAQAKLGSSWEQGSDQRRVAMLEALSAENHAASMFELGKAYYFGELGLPVDHDQAVALLQRASDEYHAPAFYYLGLAYAQGNGVRQDTAKAAYFYERGTRYDDPQAILALGQFYRDGRGVDRNPTKAFELLERAADAGLSAAMTDLGFLYYDGQGVAQDQYGSVRYFERGFEAGDALAGAQLGYMYENGVAVDRDLVRARGYYETSAERGNAYAKVQFGFMLRDGDGGPADPKRAFQLFRQAAEVGNADGLAAVAFSYERGLGVDKDMAKALDWYERAAQANSGWGTFNLGWLLIYGDADIRDAERGLKAMHQAAKLAYARAYSELGYIYSEGAAGLPLDHKEAVKWYQKGVEEGRADAMNGLALQYDFGWGVERDHVKAADLYHRAAELNNAQALVNLGFAYHGGLGVTRDDAKAIDFFERSLVIDDQNTTALTNLAWAYEQGQGTAQDHDKARGLYQQAVDLGSKQGRFALARWQHYGIDGLADPEAALAVYEEIADYSRPVRLELARLTQDEGQQIKRYQALAKDSVGADDFARLSTFANNLGGVECELATGLAPEIARAELGYLQQDRKLIEQAVEAGYTAAAFLLGEDGAMGSWDDYQRAYALGCPDLELE